MRWFSRHKAQETFSTDAFPTVGSAQKLLLARLAHHAGPVWHELYGDPLSWLEQIYYELEDSVSQVNFSTAIIGLLNESGVRWAALTLIRTLRLQAAAPELLRLATEGTLRGQAEGPCNDLQLYLIVALEELAVREAIPFLQAESANSPYAVSACLALMRIEPSLAVPHVPDVALASSNAAEGASGMLGSIGSILATTLRDQDSETFLAMVRALQGCDRRVRIHAADALRRQGELGVKPELEAKARRLLLYDIDHIPG